MIFIGSRYQNADVQYVLDGRTNTTRVTAFRVGYGDQYDWNTYYWKVGDRIDLIAFRVFGNAAYWWKIMDMNPEIVDPASLIPGTAIRLPSV